MHYKKNASMRLKLFGNTSAANALTEMVLSSYVDKCQTESSYVILQFIFNIIVCFIPSVHFSDFFYVNNRL